MNIGWFGRAFNYEHRPLSTRTHIVDDTGKVLCRYKPHKTMKFQWCSGITTLEYLECSRCKKIISKLILKKGASHVRK